MNNLDRKKFDEVFIRVNKIYIPHYEIDQGVADSFFKLLQSFDLKIVVGAFENHLLKYKSEPKPAHIVEQCFEILKETKANKKIKIEAQKAKNSLPAPKKSVDNIIEKVRKDLENNKSKSFDQLIAEHELLIKEGKRTGKIQASPFITDALKCKVDGCFAFGSVSESMTGGNNFYCTKHFPGFNH